MVGSHIFSKYAAIRALIPEYMTKFAEAGNRMNEFRAALCTQWIMQYAQVVFIQLNIVHDALRLTENMLYR